MKKLLTSVFGLLPVILFAQAGHIMQGIGAVNMSMGGAATAQPLDIMALYNGTPPAYRHLIKKYFRQMQDYFFLHLNFHPLYPHLMAPLAE